MKSQSPNRVQLRCAQHTTGVAGPRRPRLNPLTGSNCGVRRRRTGRGVRTPHRLNPLTGSNCGVRESSSPSSSPECRGLNPLTGSNCGVPQIKKPECQDSSFRLNPLTGSNCGVPHTKFSPESRDLAASISSTPPNCQGVNRKISFTPAPQNQKPEQIQNLPTKPRIPPRFGHLPRWGIHKKSKLSKTNQQKHRPHHPPPHARSQALPARDHHFPTRRHRS